MEESRHGADNFPAELLEHCGEETTKTLASLCPTVWKPNEWPIPWMQSLVIPLPKTENNKQCRNYRITRFISHPSKVMLRAKHYQTSSEEELLTEEEADFRQSRSRVEQMFNCPILIEKHLQHQQDLPHNFIDFKKAFDSLAQCDGM